MILLGFSCLYVVTSGVTQWGSKYLGDQGYTAIEILRHFYGNNMYINTAEEISGIPASWPGAPLDIGSFGNKVRQIQEQLNTIAGSYPALPNVTADGIYGEATQNAVREFRFRESLIFLLQVWWIILPGTKYRKSLWAFPGLPNWFEISVIC